MNSATNSKMTTAWSSDGKRVVPLEGPLKARTLVHNPFILAAEEEKGYKLFLNMLKSMHCVLDVAMLSGVFADESEGLRFRTDPFQWFLDNQGDKARRIYKLVMNRQ
jgi:hypothetical protein